MESWPVWYLVAHRDQLEITFQGFGSIPVAREIYEGRLVGSRLFTDAREEVFLPDGVHPVLNRLVKNAEKSVWVFVGSDKTRVKKAFRALLKRLKMKPSD